MTTYLVQFAIAFASFMVIDLVWLGVVARSFYRDQLGSLMAQNPIWPSAVLFYILFIIGLLYFAISPGIDASSLAETLKRAAAYGFFTYMTYELTNYAVIENWPSGLVLIDIVWGVILSTSVAFVTYQVYGWLS